jgi:hypothetical protein
VSGTSQDPREPPGSRTAPFVVFGAMLLVAITSLTWVLIHHWKRDQPYLDPQEIRPGTVDRVPPPGPTGRTTGYQ